MALLKSERDQRGATLHELVEIRRQRDLLAEELRVVKEDARTSRVDFSFYCEILEISVFLSNV